MSSGAATAVDVPVALLGYGTVGSAVHRLLEESAEDIARATGHRLRVVRVLVRDLVQERAHVPEPGILTDDFEAIASDPGIALAAELMGGLEPTTSYVLELLRRGIPVVTANKQLIARSGPELFATAAEGGVQLRFEASVCAAIPVIKLLRESLVATNVHRVLGIVNGTTNFVLGEMERGRSYADSLAEAQRLGYAEADPTEDVTGLDAAAKMAILATVAFGSRVPLEHVEVAGIDALREKHVAAARALEMRVKLVGEAVLVGERVGVRVGPAFVDAHHPLASVEGAFNAVMLQGDAIREITLEGPGAGGIETASAVVADMVSILGASSAGFLQEDPVWRSLEPLPAGELPSPYYLRLEVEDRAGVLARLAQELANEGVSVARLVQQPGDGHAVLHVVTHEAPAGRVAAALRAIRGLPESSGEATALPVVSSRGVEELGWA
jgi:homoserine dehydrogenase